VFFLVSLSGGSAKHKQDLLMVSSLYLAILASIAIFDDGRSHRYSGRWCQAWISCLAALDPGTQARSPVSHG